MGEKHKCRFDDLLFHQLFLYNDKVWIKIGNNIGSRIVGTFTCSFYYDQIVRPVDDSQMVEDFIRKTC